MSSILLEARPYRPFKSSEEYLEAMKEDLAEWLNTMYPVLEIHADNFMDRLDTGVPLCKHANNVRQAAEDYLARRQARNKSMTRSMTSGLAGPILTMGNVHYLPAAKSGTFFARDNVSNFITWCRKSLKIFECLLFETDDLIMRKNEKHVILCLLEVARRGAKFGMLAPMLVQMERQIDREIAADNKANGIGCGTQTDNNCYTLTNSIATETELFDSDTDEEDDNNPMLVYGPQPQIITNDLKSLDEMVRDLVEKCTCPSQFPMVRVSEGKYRIGDTKVLIFVRILRSHVMVRVGGGWDTLSHYLDKHDPCRCRSQHRSSLAARLIPRANNQTNGIELHKAQVIFERSPPTARKVIQPQTGANVSPTNATQNNNSLRSPTISALKPRSRSPTPQRKYLNQVNNASDNNSSTDKQHVGISSPNLARRSMSPSPRRLIDIRKKQTSLDTGSSLTVNSIGNKPIATTAEITTLPNNLSSNHVQFDSLNLITTSSESNTKLEIVTPPNGTVSNEGNKFENISDNGSEISDEGYRSLGVIQSNAQKRESLHSQTSLDDAENNVRHDQTSSDSQLSPSDEPTCSTKTPENTDITNGIDTDVLDTCLEPAPTEINATKNKFEQSGVFISEDDITVDIANATGLRKTGFSTKVYGSKDNTPSDKSTSKTKPARTPAMLRRRSVDDSRSSNHGSQGSLNDINSRTGLPVFNRKQPVYRSVRTSTNEPVNNKIKPAAREITNTWNGRCPTATTIKKRPSISSETFSPVSSSFERNSKTRSSQILYDSNGRRVKGATSLTTSPIKNNQSSPLAQQLLEAASNAKNDAQILEKMKQLFSRYSTLTNKNGKAVIKKAPICDDFTRAWVHSNGNLERASSCSPPSKGQSKRSSAASSVDSTHSRDTSGVGLPRKNRGNSKIPCPIRQKTELY